MHCSVCNRQFIFDSLYEHPVNVLERQIFQCLPDHLEGPDGQPRDIAEDEDKHDDATDPRQPVLHGAPLRWIWTNR